MMSNHWGPRVGWIPGRKMWAFYIVFDDGSDVGRIVDEQQVPLQGVSALDLVRREWIHLSMQGVQFSDRVSPAEVEKLINVARTEVGRWTLPALEILPAMVDSNAVVLPVGPSEVLASLKAVLYEVAATTVGLDNVLELPGPVAGFLPHITIAYSNRQLSSSYVSMRLADLTDSSSIISNAEFNLSLVRVQRDNRKWSWDFRCDVTQALP